MSPIKPLLKLASFVTTDDYLTLWISFHSHNQFAWKEISDEKHGIDIDDKLPVCTKEYVGIKLLLKIVERDVHRFWDHWWWVGQWILAWYEPRWIDRRSQQNGFTEKRKITQTFDINIAAKLTNYWNYWILPNNSWKLFVRFLCFYYICTKQSYSTMTKK